MAGPTQNEVETLATIADEGGRLSIDNVTNEKRLADKGLVDLLDHEGVADDGESFVTRVAQLTPF